MKKAAAVFTVLFILIIAVPAPFSNYSGSVSEKENRNLAEAPQLTKSGRVNFDFFKDAESYLNDRVGFRELLTGLNSSLNYRLLRKRGNSRALLGKEGWLFYIDRNDGNNLLDFQKRNLFSPAELVLFYEQVRRRAEWCENLGIQFLFIIAPNKHSVYSEYYPFRRPGGMTRLDQILDGMPDELKDKVIVPRDYLLSKKDDPLGPLYYETDTHWNMLGGFYACEFLREAVKAAFPETAFPEIRYRKTVTRVPGAGDIVPMLGLESYGKETKIAIEPESGWETYYSYTIKEDVPIGEHVVTDGVDPALPRALIYRDSFFRAVQPYFSNDFSHAEYIWKILDENDKAYIREQKPDILIWEIVERYAGNVPGSWWR
ncbi:MAG: hypothetical protein LBC62_08470 [Treponema sp.]|jgi:hypothetical protein|nr:hypothetical protein [Treponema sp.]